MQQQEFDQATIVVADQAWHNALLFEILATAYSALARGRKDEWDNALIKLRDLPKDDLFTPHLREMHADICDRGWGEDLEIVTSEIFAALDPLATR